MVHIHHFKTHHFLHTKQSRIKTKMPLHDKKMLAFVVIGIMISLPLVTINLATIHQFAGIGVGFQKSSSAVDIPLMTKDDLIFQTRSAFVIPEYKLIFFTFPKVACSEWKRMFMRINGNPNWCKIRGFNAHDPQKNKIKVLNDYEPEVATAMMTSPAWTRAAILREPKERVLSAFLDKAVKEDYYVRKCCNNLPNEKAKQQCIDNELNLESFLYFVTKYPKKCFDVHWEPQIAKIDKKWWPYIDKIGFQHNLLNDSKEILSQLTSSRNDGISAWDSYGTTGWGNSDECENRTHSFLEENSSAHNLDTGSQLLKWYTAETEKIVEEKWAIEWSEEMVNFPKLNLFGKK